MAGLKATLIQADERSAKQSWHCRPRKRVPNFDWREIIFAPWAYKAFRHLQKCPLRRDQQKYGVKFVAWPRGRRTGAHTQGQTARQNRSIAGNIAAFAHQPPRFRAADAGNPRGQATASHGFAGQSGKTFPSNCKGIRGAHTIGETRVAATPSHPALRPAWFRRDSYQRATERAQPITTARG